MKLKRPDRNIFWISVVLFIVAALMFAGFFVIPIDAFWILLIAYVVLLAAVLW